MEENTYVVHAKLNKEKLDSPRRYMETASWY